MAKNLGRERSAGLAKETVYGTAVNPTHWVPYQDFSFKDARETITDNSALGTRDDFFGQDTDYEYSQGNLNGLIYDKSFGLVALAAFGKVTTSAVSGATGAFSHLFELQNTLPSFTISSKDPKEAKRFAGAVLDQLEISAATNSYATYTSTWRGRKGEAENLTPVTSEEVRFRPQDVKLYIADSVVALDQATKFCTTNFTFTLNNNLATNSCLGTEDPDFDPGLRSMELTFNKMYVDTAFKDLVTNGSKKAFRIEIKRSDVQIGSGSPTNPSIVLDFELGMFTEWNREGGLDELETETINYKPIRSFVSGKTMTMKITNTETSY